MVESISDKLRSLLDEYYCKVEGILGLGISTSNGLEISSYFNNIVDPQMAHAISSSLYNHNRHSAKRLGFDRFKLNLTYTDDGIIALKKISDDTTLIIVMAPDANVGLALLEMDDIVNRLNVLI